MVDLRCEDRHPGHQDIGKDLDAAMLEGGGR